MVLNGFGFMKCRSFQHFCWRS